VSMTNRRQDFLPELLGEERRALGDAGGAQSSLLAGKRYEVLGLASPASQPGEAVFQTATIEERLDDRSDDGAERSRPRLEAFLVDRDRAKASSPARFSSSSPRSANSLFPISSAAPRP
jgi:hypothetical protein